MLEPGYFHLTIRLETPGDVPIDIVDKNNDPVPLTLLAPFKAQVRETPDSDLLLEMTIVDTDLVAGKMNLTWAIEDVVDLPLIHAMWDLIDAAGNRWVEGPATIQPKSITQLTPP